MDTQIAKEFEEFGVDVNAEVLAKCLEICISFNIEDASEFVEQWIAYSVSHFNGGEPTIEYLDEFERKDLAGKRDKQLNAKKQLNSTSALNGNAGGGGGGSSFQDDEDDEMLGAYICNTPKAKKSISRTPAHSDVISSPSSRSMLGSQTPRSQNEGSGKIVYTFGNPSLLKSASWCSTKPQNIIPKQLIQHEGVSLTIKTKYMYDNLSERTAIDADKIFDIGQKICKKKFGDDTSLFKLVNVDEVSQDEVLTIGRIFCEFGGKLDATSAMLLGSNELICRTVRLNFSNSKPFSVFPGQVVMTSGLNPRGDTLMVREIITDKFPLKPVETPKVDQEINLVIAAGPFTNSEDLHYDPLNDLLLYCKDNKPDCLVLIGPFMDIDHSVIRGEIVLDKSFETFFEEMLASIVEVVGQDVTVCCVSSYKDVCADSVYPTLPMTLKKTYPNVFMLPDPSIVELKNGLVLGVTSVDVADHILEYELAVNAGDKVKRVVNNLFEQETFYPLMPPADEDMCYDGELASKFGKIDQIPNILILPSIQKSYIRDINNCLTVNPGRLTDAKGGTFARMVITPPKEGAKLMNYVACQVRKI